MKKNIEAKSHRVDNNEFINKNFILTKGVSQCLNYFISSYQNSYFDLRYEFSTNQYDSRLAYMSFENIDISDESLGK